MINARMALILGKVIIILGVFFFGLLFLVQNIDVLKQNFTLSLELFGTGVKWAPEQQVPYYYLLIGSFALGGVFATAFFILDRIGVSLTLLRQKREHAKTVHVLEGEITRLNAECARLGKECETQRLEGAKSIALEATPKDAAASADSQVAESC